MGAEGDIKNMAMHEFVWFVILLVLIGTMGSYVILKLFHQMFMSPQEKYRVLHSPDMVEMQDLMQDREYEEESGKILLPMAC